MASTEPSGPSTVMTSSTVVGWRPAKKHSPWARVPGQTTPLPVAEVDGTVPEVSPPGPSTRTEKVPVPVTDQASVGGANDRVLPTLTPAGVRLIDTDTRVGTVVDDDGAVVEGVVAVTGSVVVDELASGTVLVDDPPDTVSEGPTVVSADSATSGTGGSWVSTANSTTAANNTMATTAAMADRRRRRPLRLSADEPDPEPEELSASLPEPDVPEPDDTPPDAAPRPGPLAARGARD